ncbi:MAG: transporter [Gammaproteobacteria bacterium]|nr:transporter [Gammaproteobacteria bacterium]
MILIFTAILLFILLSRILEQSFKVPSTLSLLLLAFFVNLYFPGFINLTNEDFDEILYLMLPLILLPDVLNLSIVDIRRNYRVILYMAVVAVVVSIIAAVLITPFLLPETAWSLGMLISLFAMLMATDAITVNAIMARFKLPERLKIYAESESLLNDITALVIFYFIGLPLLTGESVGALLINITLFKMLVLSVAIGALSAWIGYLTTKILKDTVEQFILIYLVVNISFLLAEHFHAAGILAIVSSVMILKVLIQKELNNRNRLPDLNNNGESYASLLNWVQKLPANTSKNFRGYRKEAMFIGTFANAGVFISMAVLFDPSLLHKYWIEILTIFALTTSLRAVAITALVRSMHLPGRWITSLTLAGTKGALAIIMVHAIPKGFEYQEMFEAIVIGIIILTTFGYTALLIWHVTRNQEAYHQDQQQFDLTSNINPEELIQSLHNAIERDEISKAYNSTYFETILGKELSRSRRYKIELSAIMVEVCSHRYISGRSIPCSEITAALGEVVTGLIRNNDYFGKLDENYYVVLVTNTGLSGTMILAQRIDQLFHDKLDSDRIVARYGITAFAESDTNESMQEKMENALKRTRFESGHNIQIEI